MNMIVYIMRLTKASYLIIRDDGSSEIITLERENVVRIRNKDPSVVRIRKMNYTTIDKCNSCRESHILEDEIPDCRLCRDMWAVKTMSGKKVDRPIDIRKARSNEDWGMKR